MPESLEVAAKLVAYLAVLVALGCAGASWLSTRSGMDAFADLPGRAVSLALPASAALVAATLVRAWAHTAAAFGAGDAWAWENLSLIALESRWGSGWRLQALGAALLLAAAAAVRVSVTSRRPPSAAARVLWTAAAVAAALAVPQTGHAAAEPYRWVLHGIHVVAAGLWAGTLLVAVTLRRPARVALPHLLRLFGSLATPAVAVVAVSGLWASALYLGSVGNLVSTEYGRLLLAKSSVVVVMGALGGVNWLRLRRSNQAGLPLTVYLEAGLAVAVVMVTAWLTETAHP